MGTLLGRAIVSVIFSALAATAVVTAAPAETHPNILFILSDNQAASLLGSYGNPDIKTPNLDRLAQEGVRFSRAYAVNGLCSPTRATLMTGLMPSQHGVHSWLIDAMLKEWPRDWVAIQEFRTLPVTLRNRGYETAMIGKWHLGQPWQAAPGYDHWVTFPLGHTVDFWNNTIITREGSYQVNDQHIVEHFTDVAVQFIEHYDGERPFYLQLNYDGPYMNPPTNYGPARNRFYKDYVGKEFDSFPRTALNANVIEQIQGPPFDPAVSFLNWAMSMIARMHNDPATMANAASQNTLVDDAVGRVLDALRRKNIDGNTLVIYSSDQGTFYGQHGLWTHTVATSPASPYETAMRVPLIIRHTGNIPAGRVVERLTGQYDIMPTILDYAGFSAVEIESSPGQSFAPLLRGESMDDEPDAVFFEQEETRVVRTRDSVYWKRLGTTGKSALYDMNADPEQRNNLIDEYSHQDRLQQLDERLTAFFDTYVNDEYDLWHGGTAKGSVDRPWIFKQIYGEQWTTHTEIKPAFSEPDNGRGLLPH